MDSGYKLSTCLGLAGFRVPESILLIHTQQKPFAWFLQAC